MRIFVYGGSGSGKSEFAEQAALRLDGGRRYYIATMRPLGPGAEARVARHRAARAGRGFETLERYDELAAHDLEPGIALLECLGNLVANRLFADDARLRDPKTIGEIGLAIFDDIETLARRMRHTVIVSNDVFSDGTEYPPETEMYRGILAGVNRRLAAASEAAAEVVCGIPVYHRKPAAWAP